MDYDYFSIDAILAENQKIHCTFKLDVPGMGHLAEVLIRISRL